MVTLHPLPFPARALGQFRFTYSMNEQDCDLIHKFVLKKQIEMIRRNRKLEMSLVE
ncbi:MAG TPA: hypothetical protein QGF86_05020 [Nitrospinaceae bacterium]|jgi:hypothetical protein|nr:hypothetical protein [Nitrospinaceae bacterium]